MLSDMAYIKGSLGVDATGKELFNHLIFILR